jgi:hypothetical protein
LAYPINGCGVLTFWWRRRAPLQPPLAGSGRSAKRQPRNQAPYPGRAGINLLARRSKAAFPFSILAAVCAKSSSDSTTYCAVFIRASRFLRPISWTGGNLAMSGDLVAIGGLFLLLRHQRLWVPAQPSRKEGRTPPCRPLGAESLDHPARQTVAPLPDSTRPQTEVRVSPTPMRKTPHGIACQFGWRWNSVEFRLTDTVTVWPARQSSSPT